MRYQVIDRGVQVRGIARVQGETLSLSDEEAQQFGGKVRPVDAKGEPIKNVPSNRQPSKGETKQHPTGGRKRARFDGWGYQSSSGWLGRGPDSEVQGELSRSRDRAFDVSLDDRFAKRVVDMLTNNVIGKGISLQAKVQKQRGGELDERTNRLIEEAWEEWLDKESCHTAGLQHFNELQKVCFSSCVHAGESFVRFVRQPFGNSKIALALETIESAQLPVEQYTRTTRGDQVRMGVELNEWLRPQGYWFYSFHPGEFYQAYSKGRDRSYSRYDAKDILHLYSLRRINQHRGLSWLKATQEPLKHLAGFNEAYLYAARVGACVAGILQSGYPDQLSPQEEEEVDTPSGPRPVGKIEPGTFYQLPQGDTFTGFDPKRPESAYEPFIRAQLRGIAAGTNTTYEELSSDYSQANYSSIRQSHVISIYYWQVLQDWFCREFLDKIYQEFIYALYLAYPNWLGSYPDNPDRFQGKKARRWITRGWSWVDPLKESAAVEKLLSLGLTSLTHEAAKQGQDFEALMRDRAREIKLMTSIAEAEGISPDQLSQSFGGEVDPNEVEE